MKRKDRYSLSLDMKMMEEIEDMWREYVYKERTNISLSDFIQKLIKLGLRAKRGGYFLDSEI